MVLATSTFHRITKLFNFHAEFDSRSFETRDLACEEYFGGGGG